MITKWVLSQNCWEYESELIVESKTMPTVKTDEGPHYRVTVEMTVDGVTLTFREPLELVKIDGKPVEKKKAKRQPTHWPTCMKKHPECLCLRCDNDNGDCCLFSPSVKSGCCVVRCSKYTREETNESTADSTHA